MKDYKQWTAAQRWQNLDLYKCAKALGLISAPCKCVKCGQTRGILQTHCVDYDVSLSLLPKLLDGSITADERAKLTEVLLPLCWRCHMMLHKGEEHPLSAARYFEEVAKGKQYAPVWRYDAWYELTKHMID